MTAPVNKARVVYGWSMYEDFVSYVAAEVRARELAGEPTRDPHRREVRILDLTTTPHRTVATFHREVIA